MYNVITKLNVQASALQNIIPISFLANRRKKIFFVTREYSFIKRASHVQCR